MIHFKNKDCSVSSLLERLQSDPENLKNTFLKVDRNDQTPLSIAVRDGDDYKLKTVLKICQELNILDNVLMLEYENERNILHIAVITNNREAVQCLIQLNTEILQIMISKSDIYGETPLMIAAMHNSFEIFEAVMKKWQVFNSLKGLSMLINNSRQNIIHLAVTCCREDNVKHLLELLKADTETLKKLLSTSDHCDETPLMMATKKESFENFRAITTACEHLDILDVELSKENIKYQNIVNIAMHNRKIEITDRLFGLLKSDVENLKTMLLKTDRYGETPLLVSAARDCSENVRAIIKLSQELDVLEKVLLFENKKGQNFLHKLGDYGLVDVVDFLLKELNVDPGILKKLFSKSDATNSSVLMYATSSESVDYFRCVMNVCRDLGILDSELTKENDDNQNIVHFVVRNKIPLKELLDEMKNDEKMLKKFLLEPDYNNETPLTTAARVEFIDNFQYLLKIYQDFNILDSEKTRENSYGHNLIHLTIRSRSINCVLELIKQDSLTLKSLLLKSDINGETPLMIAASKDFDDCFQIVLNLYRELDLFPSNIFDENKNGQNILHQIVRNEHIEPLNIILDLIKTDSEIFKTLLTKCEHSGDTALTILARDGPLSNFQKMIETCDHLNILNEELKRENAEGQNIIFSTVVHKHSDTFNYLIDRLKSNSEVLKDLLLKSDINGETPLMFAARKVDLNNFLIMMKVSKELNILDNVLSRENKDGQNIAHLAVQSENGEIFNELSKEIDSETLKRLLLKQDNCGLIPLLIPIKERSLDNFHNITKVYQDLDVLGNEILNKIGQNIFHLAVQTSEADIISYFIEQLKIDPEKLKISLSASDSDGNTPLMISASSEYMNGLQIMLDIYQKLNILNAEVLKKNNEGHNLFNIIAMHSDGTEMVGLLDRLKNDSELLKMILTMRNLQCETPLMTCARCGSLENFRALLKVCKELNILNGEVLNEDAEGRSMVFLAVMNGCDVLNCLFELLKGDPEMLKGLLSKPSCNGETPLFYLAQFGQLDVFKITVEICQELKIFDSQIESKTANEQNVAHLVATRCRSDVLNYLYEILKVDSEKLKSMLSKSDEAGCTPLMLAAENEKHNLFRAISNMYEELGILDSELLKETKDSQNVVHLAVQNRNVKNVQYLIDRLKADPEVLKNFLLKPDRDGNTSFMFLIASGRYRNLSALVKICQELNILETQTMNENNDGQNIMHLALRNFDDTFAEYFFKELDLEILKKMLSKSDCDEETPLMVAVKGESTEKLETTINMYKKLNIFDSELSSQNKKGQNLIHLAVISLNFQITDYLLNKANIDTEQMKQMLLKCDENCETPLMFAARRGYKYNISTLITIYQELNIFNSELMKRNNKEENIFHLALLNSKEIVEYLMEQLKMDSEKLEFLLSQANGNGESPLIVAVKNKCVEELSSIVETCKECNILESVLRTIGLNEDLIKSALNEKFKNNLLE